MRPRMTAPRQVLPNSTYLVTRRCAQRQFLLRPSEDVNAVFRFVLALSAARYGIELHAFVVMSDHFHLVLTDPEARLPDFMRDLNAFVARACNSLHGRWESFWDPRAYSAVRLLTPDAIVEKTAYVLANPVAVGLVPRGTIWPGLWSDPDRIGAGAVTVERPTQFFNEKKGLVPAAVALELVTPPGFQSAAEFRDRVVTQLEASERDAMARFGKNGFLGVKKVLAQKPTDRPRSVEPRRQLSPRVATRDKWRRIEALAQLKEFVTAYREAWARRRAGDLTAVFPAGTYLLRVLHGVPCASAA